MRRRCCEGAHFKTEVAHQANGAGPSLLAGSPARLSYRLTPRTPTPADPPSAGTSGSDWTSRTPASCSPRCPSAPDRCNRRRRSCASRRSKRLVRVQHAWPPTSKLAFSRSDCRGWFKHAGYVTPWSISPKDAVTHLRPRGCASPVTNPQGKPSWSAGWDASRPRAERQQPGEGMGVPRSREREVAIATGESAAATSRCG